MDIRKATPGDTSRLMEIFERARAFMRETGNPRQWSAYGWPPQELILRDIELGRSYVCEEAGRVVGTFCFIFGDRAEPTYNVIENGAWVGGDTYGVIHRLASDGSVRGVGECAIGWAYGQCGHLRIDTHADNKVMQGLLAKLGFVYCGHIRVEQDTDIRLAYEKL